MAPAPRSLACPEVSAALVLSLARSFIFPTLLVLSFALLRYCTPSLALLKSCSEEEERPISTPQPHSSTGHLKIHPTTTTLLVSFALSFLCTTSITSPLLITYSRFTPLALFIPPCLALKCHLCASVLSWSGNLLLHLPYPAPTYLGAARARTLVASAIKLAHIFCPFTLPLLLQQPFFAKLSVVTRHFQA